MTNHGRLLVVSYGNGATEKKGAQIYTCNLLNNIPHAKWLLQIRTPLLVPKILDPDTD
jgi:hypothetical protein